jgi:hypothetical protein
MTNAITYDPNYLIKTFDIEFLNLTYQTHRFLKLRSVNTIDQLLLKSPDDMRDIYTCEIIDKLNIYGLKLSNSHQQKVNNLLLKSSHLLNKE